MPRPDANPWVLVAGGFHQRGGMDRANAALASYLSSIGTPVHLVGHDIDPELMEGPLVTTHVVPRPKRMPALAEWLLGRAGIAVARAVTGRAPDARVVVNGGNCAWPDINWVHAVHEVWPVRDDGAPAWSRFRNRRLKDVACRREKRALRHARVVIANSESTRYALVHALGVNGDRVHTVYLGSNRTWGLVKPAERLAARTELGIPHGAPTVSFVGALGVDTNKGFDVLWDSWLRLHRRGSWDCHLIVAGAGWRLRRWQQDAAREGLLGSIHFIGFTNDVRQVLAASDLLVSPARYEAYGLNVHEALSCGVPVMVTRTAGVVERFERAMSAALLPDPLDAQELANRLAAWRNDMRGWRDAAVPTIFRIRARSWTDMAAEFVDVTQRVPRRLSA